MAIPSTTATRATKPGALVIPDESTELSPGWLELLAFIARQPPMPDLSDGACVGAPNPNDAFPAPGLKGIQQAEGFIAEYCDRCPLATKAACLEYGKTQSSGIWGGLNRARRGPRAVKADLCRRGHDDWMQVAKTSSASGRRCRTCHRNNSRRSKHRQALAAPIA